MLRDYQEQGVADIRLAMRGVKNERIFYREGFSGPARRILYVLSTGGGKTRVFSHIAEKAASKGNKTLSLAHRKELVKQASLSVGDLGQKHMIIAPQSKVNDIRGAHVDRFGEPLIRRQADLAIASVQTLARRLEWLDEFEPSLLIIDEAHHAPAGQWSKVAAACPGSMILGVTATPCRTDGRGLGESFDAMVLGPSMGWLIENGYLVPPKVFRPPSQVDASSVRKKGGDLDTDQLAELYDKPKITGDAIEHYSQLTPGKPAIVFCANVKHSRNVAKQFRDCGWNFEVVTGTTDEAVRDARIAGLASGELHGIVSVDVLSEGTDIPVAEVAILLRKTDSLSLFLQQCGRVLRPADGKDCGWILDHVGNTSPANHGLPHWDQGWSLDSVKRSQRKKSEEVSKPLLLCPECYHQHEPALECPACGHVYTAEEKTIKVGEGVLEEVQDQDLERLLAARKSSKMPIYGQLLKQGKGKDEAMAIAEALERKNQLKHYLALAYQGFIQEYGRNTLDFDSSDIKSMKTPELEDRIKRMPILSEIMRRILNGAEVDWKETVKKNSSELEILLNGLAEKRFFG